MIRTHEHLEMLAREVDEYLGTIRLQMYLKGAPAGSTPWLVVHGTGRTNSTNAGTAVSFRSRFGRSGTSIRFFRPL